MLKSKPKTLLLVYIVLALVYIFITLFAPLDSNKAAAKYHLTSTQLHILSLTVVLPFVVIWFIGFYGYDRIRQYAATIRNTQDGTPINMLSQGLMWLGLYFPLSTILSVISTRVADHWPRLEPTSVIVYNYAVLILLIISFYTLLRGSRKLTETVKHRAYRLKEQLAIAIFIVVSGLYAYVTLHDPARQFPQITGGHATFYLPDVLLVLTIIIPSVFVWYAGIKTAYNIYLYCANVAGVLYRQALIVLAYGIAFAATGVMAIRYLSSLTTFLNSATLKLLLVIIYLLLVVVAISFTLIAAGAKRLQKIEEV